MTLYFDNLNQCNQINTFQSESQVSKYF